MACVKGGKLLYNKYDTVSVNMKVRTPPPKKKTADSTPPLWVGSQIAGDAGGGGMGTGDGMGVRTKGEGHHMWISGTPGVTG